MKAGALVVLALFILSGTLGFAAQAQAYQSAKIVVQVTDQNGLSYDGVQVTIYSTTASNTSSGVTFNGIFVSVALLANTNYTVLVSSGSQSESKSIYLGITDTLVNFTLTRPAPLRPRLVISSVSYNPSTVTPGSAFNVTINLNNTGIGTAYAGAVTLHPGPGINFVGTTGTAAIGELSQGQNTTVQYQMEATSTMPSGFIPVGVTFSYTDVNDRSYNDSTTFNVQIVARPDVRVGEFSLSVAPLRPGISSVLSLTLINVGGDTAYGVSVTVTGPQFITGQAINYLGTVSAATSDTAQFYLSVLNTTAAGSYPLYLNINYTDVSGHAYNRSSEYMMNVEPFSPPAVSVTNVLLDPPVLTTGATGTVTIFLTNAGSSSATNVEVRLLNGTGIVASNYFGLGTMAPKGQVTQVVGINVGNLKPQSRTLQIQVTYSDINGNSYTTTVPYQTEVYPAVNPFALGNIAVVVGLVLLALFVLILIRRYDLLTPLRRTMSQ